MVTIYILECKDGKYYVGKTKNLGLRLDQHRSGVGSEWTKIHPPIKILEKYEDCDGYDEDKYTLKTMQKYGIDNVRGGSWSKLAIDPIEKESIKKRLLSAEDRCFKCGKRGHFQKDCSEIIQKVQIKGLVSKPEYNDKVGIVEGWCQEKDRWLVRLPDKTDPSVLPDEIDPPVLSGKQLYVKDINIREAPIFPERCCSRCGRRNHRGEKCYAKKDIHKNDIWW